MSTEHKAAPAGAIDITPTWGEWGRIYARFAESGEGEACRRLRADLARALAAAQALQDIRATLTDEQAATVGRVMAAELTKQGF